MCVCDCSGLVSWYAAAAAPSLAHRLLRGPSTTSTDADGCPYFDEDSDVVDRVTLPRVAARRSSTAAPVISPSPAALDVRIRLYLLLYNSRSQCTMFYLKGKAKRSPYSITERRVPELIPVLCSQPAVDVIHKPGGRLPLLSDRPAVILATLATNFTCLVNRGTMGVNSLPKTVTRQRRSCDLNPSPTAPESSTLTVRPRCSLK